MDKLITDKKWEKVSTRRTTIHRAFDYTESIYIGLDLIIGNNVPEAILISKEGEIFQYQPTDQIKDFNNTLGSFFENKKGIAKIKDKMFSDTIDFIDWLKIYCSKDKVERLSNEEIKKLLLERHEGHISLVNWQWIGFSGKYVLDAILTKILDKYQINNLKNLEIIYKHQRPIHAVEEDLNVKKISLKQKKGENVEVDISKHLEKYQGVYMYDETYPLATREEIIERINKNFDNEALELEVKKIEKEFEKAKKDYENFLKSQPFSGDNLFYFEFARAFSDFMELRNMYRGLAAFYSKDFFAEIASRLNTSLINLLAYNDYEIAEFLDKPKEDIKIEAERRRKHTAFLYNKGDWRVFSLEESARIDLIMNSEEEISEFKGVVAFKAPPMKGTVKIINSVADMGKLEPGDILVASMTRPEFIMSIEKAGAIITDEGGTLCHAAIVSRELKKPCIIGTKIATKVLKDGMMVEVDANAGVVRIIK